MLVKRNGGLNRGAGFENRDPEMGSFGESGTF
jgi:hypothetical protein